MPASSASCFNPRTPWGVRQLHYKVRGGRCQVSIHALRGECDGKKSQRPTRPTRFNPRTPWGVRRKRQCTAWVHHRFQSTHSVGSATYGECGECGECGVSIHALRGECDAPSKYTSPVHFWVSIHALRGECDLTQHLTEGSESAFQSTHSVGSATLARHSLGVRGQGFNPRTPWGVRPHCRTRRSKS